MEKNPKDGPPHQASPAARSHSGSSGSVSSGSGSSDSSSSDEDEQQGALRKIRSSVAHIKVSNVDATFKLDNQA